MFRRNIAYLVIIHLWGVSNKNSTEILQIFLAFTGWWLILVDWDMEKSSSYGILLESYTSAYEH
jgi:hypothetical protein